LPQKFRKLSPQTTGYYNASDEGHPSSKRIGKQLPKTIFKQGFALFIKSLLAVLSSEIWQAMVVVKLAEGMQRYNKNLYRIEYLNGGDRHDIPQT
jgi:hypothetical protein